MEHPALPDAITVPLDGLEIVHEVSVGWKKVPLIVTLVPTGPIEGLRKITGPLITIRVAWAKAPGALPVTVIKYCPGATFPTVKLPLYPAVVPPEPAVMAQLEPDTTLPEPVMVHDVIAPDVAVNCPETPTSCPVLAVVGLAVLGPIKVIVFAA